MKDAMPPYGRQVIVGRYDHADGWTVRVETFSRERQIDDEWWSHWCVPTGPNGETMEVGRG